ncbi:MAG: hexokinase [Candidatus Omnitrophica bacterium]|nr:hexokinase [Candidatus Omnitrophota bacterium]
MQRVGFKYIESAFELSSSEMQRIIKDFHSEMKKGLAGSKSSLKMIPEYVERPSGKEKGEFLALDLGGTHFRVLSLRLKSGRKTEAPLSKKFILKKELIKGSGSKLFDFIAECIKAFIAEQKLGAGEKYNVGFTFSFPTKKKNIASGLLIRWTKGFKAKGVEGKDVVRLLNSALARKGVSNTKVVAIVNDTVGTFVTRSYKDPNCDMGVILGTGTNACYCEKIKNITKWKGGRTSSGEMVINIEWGNFDKLCLTAYDKQLDSASANPGEQILEKMVSGMYLGKLAGLVANSLIEQEILFNGQKKYIFCKSKNFKSEYASAIESDTSGKLSRTNTLLKKVGIKNSTYADRKLLQRVCAIVSRRAARISASAMAAVITKIDPHLSGKHTIAVDGSVYEKHSGFSKKIKSALIEIFKKKASKIKLKLTKDGSGKGAAIIAATV